MRDIRVKFKHLLNMINPPAADFYLEREQSAAEDEKHRLAIADLRLKYEDGNR